MVNPNDIREILFKISKNIILPSFGNLAKNQISYKNGMDIVTDIDIAVEIELNNQLSKLLSKSNFIGEELYSKNPSILDYYLSDDFCWTVDPIDGTNNFAKSKNAFATMVALTKNKTIIQTFIYKPVSEEFIYADNTGTFFDAKKIILNKKKLTKESIGSISSKFWDEEKINKIILLQDSFKKINSYGSIGCEYFDIALGKRDFTLLSRLYPWDHIPGIHIVRQANGHDCHFDKSEYKFYENSKNLIVSNSKSFNYEILDMIKEE